MTRKKIQIAIREGKPTSCIVCGGKLHKKSEYYCSLKCESEYRPSISTEKPSFLSKWKVRKNKESKDPLVIIRKKVRRKTNNLIKEGRLKRRPCVVCSNKEVLAHHEDYTNPFEIIWLCEEHHKDYHDGKISLLKNKLKWDPSRLIPKNTKVPFLKKKYLQIEKNFNNKKREEA